MTTSDHEQRVIDETVVPRLQIGGEWRDASSGASFGVEDPATGQVLCQVSDATEEDALAALDAASGPRRRGRTIRPGSGARSCGGPGSS